MSVCYLPGYVQIICSLLSCWQETPTRGFTGQTVGFYTRVDAQEQGQTQGYPAPFSSLFASSKPLPQDRCRQECILV